MNRSVEVMMGCWVYIDLHLLNRTTWFIINLLMSVLGYVLVFKWILMGSAVCEHSVQPHISVHVLLALFIISVNGQASRYRSVQTG